jgi:hypothetical protein
MKTEPDSPAFSVTIPLSPKDLKDRVAALLAVGLYRARLPYIPGEKIKAGDLDGVAEFILGGLLGLEKASNSVN